jgi:hypothetical protein
MDEIGKLVISTLIKAGYFIIAAIVIKDILSCVTKHDMEGIVKAILGGVVGYGSLFLVTDILDKVKAAMVK